MITLFCALSYIPRLDEFLQCLLRKQGFAILSSLCLFGCRSDCRKEYFGHLSALDGPASNDQLFHHSAHSSRGKYSGGAPSRPSLRHDSPLHPLFLGTLFLSHLITKSAIFKKHTRVWCLTSSLA